MGVLEKIAPGWAAKREGARLQLEKTRAVRQNLEKLGKRSGGYEGASHGRRHAGWSTTNHGPAGATPASLDILRNRSRHLRRNNPFAAAAIAGLSRNTVGYGIQGRLTVGANPAPDNVLDLWRRWSDSTECDAAGRHTFAGLQSMNLEAALESGDVFIRRRNRATAEGLSVPLQLQTIEADFLDTSKHTRLRNGNPIRYGIEYDRRDRPVAYYFHTQHPSSVDSARSKTIRVPAEEVIHLLDVKRPGQTRGVPELAPVMSRLRHLDDYEDATIEKAKIAACFSAFIYEPNPDGGPLAVDDDEDGEIEPIEAGERIEPGIIEHLEPGKDIKFASPPSTNDYPEFVKANLRAIAAGVGVPYEVLTGDLSQTNFASGRMGWLEFHRRIEALRWQTLIPQFCDRVFSWWLEQAQIAHGIGPVQVAWTAPRREMIDPRTEVAADVARIRGGLASWAEVVREQGYEPDQVIDEIHAFDKKRDAKAIVLDSDPRKITGAGQAQTEMQPGGSDE